jgi:NADH-ubiquinone oxidoreductase B12 subunit family
MVWDNYDKWRKHPVFRPRFATVFPGLGTAAAIFSVYMVIDYARSFGAHDDHHDSSTGTVHALDNRYQEEYKY